MVRAMWQHKVPHGSLIKTKLIQLQKAQGADSLHLVAPGVCQHILPMTGARGLGICWAALPGSSPQAAPDLIRSVHCLRVSASSLPFLLLFVNVLPLQTSCIPNSAAGSMTLKTQLGPPRFPTSLWDPDSRGSCSSNLS